MNRRVPFACGQSGKLVRPDRPATWHGADLREAARKAVVSPVAPVATPAPEPREFYVGSDGQEYEVQR